MNRVMLTNVYIAPSFLLLGLTTIVFRKKPILLRLGDFSKLLALSVLADLSIIVFSQDLLDIEAFIPWVSLMLITFVIKDLWILIDVTDSDLQQKMQFTADKTLSQYAREGSSNFIKFGGGTLNISTIVSNKLLHVIKFQGEKNNKKVGLIKHLLRKQFNTVFPRIVIKLNKNGKSN